MGSGTVPKNLAFRALGSGVRHAGAPSLPGVDIQGFRI